MSIQDYELDELIGVTDSMLELTKDIKDSLDLTAADMKFIDEQLTSI